MPVLKNARHERFAQIVASGKTQADAYRTVFPSSRKWKDSAVHVKGSELAGKVKGRIDELLQAKADDGIATREELARFLTKTVRTPVGDVDDKSDLAQEVEVRASGDGVTTRVKMPSKIAAASELAKLRGYYAPEQVQTTIRIEPDPDTLDVLRR